MPSEWRRSLSVDTRCSGGPSGLRPPDEPAPPCSIDHVGHGHDAGGAHPDHEFARHAVAPPVLLGVLRSHVAAPDHRRPVGDPVSYTHLRAHETDSYLVFRLLLEK